MRISELGQQTGVPVATIKFYLREGLLPSGTPTARNQADYGENHLRRLLLIRALTGVGQLDLMSVRTLLEAIDDDRVPATDLYQVLHRVLFPAPVQLVMPGNLDEALDHVDGLLGDLGWQVGAGSPARVQFALVVATLRSLGCECDISFFAAYAEAAERLANGEIELVSSASTVADRAAIVARSVLLDVALTSMRLMAAEQYIMRRLAGGGTPSTEDRGATLQSSA
jgi:DNA-binding transcriptional MerR regulator